MRVLLDENMPPSIGPLLADHEVTHVKDLGRKGQKNGALLELCRREFDALVTLDRGILHQHNHAAQRLIILVVRVKRGIVLEITGRLPDIANALKDARPGDLIEI